MMQHHHHQRHPPLFSVSSPATLQPPSQQQQQQQQQLTMGHKPVGPTLSVPGIVLYNTGQQQQQQQGRVSPSSDIAGGAAASVSKRRQPPLFLSRQRSSAYLFDKNSPSSSSSSQQPPHSFHRIGGSPPVSAKVPPKQRKFLRSRSAFLGTVSRLIRGSSAFLPVQMLLFVIFLSKLFIAVHTMLSKLKIILFLKESLRIALFEASCKTDLFQKCLLRLRIC